jgi:DNA polymerase III delta prime subunit
MTCVDVSHVPVDELGMRNQIIHFEAIPHDYLVAYLHLLLVAEGIQVNMDDLSAFVKKRGTDLRRMMNDLEFQTTLTCKEDAEVMEVVDLFSSASTQTNDLDLLAVALDTLSELDKSPEYMFSCLIETEMESSVLVETYTIPGYEWTADALVQRENVMDAFPRFHGKLLCVV